MFGTWHPSVNPSPSVKVLPGNAQRPRVPHTRREITHDNTRPRLITASVWGGSLGCTRVQSVLETGLRTSTTRNTKKTPPLVCPNSAWNTRFVMALFGNTDRQFVRYVSDLAFTTASRHDYTLPVLQGFVPFAFSTVGSTEYGGWSTATLSRIQL